MKLRVTNIILGVQISSDTIRQECILFGGKVFPMDATYLYAFCASHNAARQVRTVTSEAEVVSGQY